MNNNLNKPSKPVTIVRAEFISNLTELINTSMLPAFILEPILKDVYLEIKTVAQRQYESDMELYEQLKQNDSNDCLEKCDT